MGLEIEETDLIRTQYLCTRWESGETDLSRPRSGLVWVWRLGRQTGLVYGWRKEIGETDLTN